MKNYHKFVDYIVNLASEYKGSSKRDEIEQYALKQADHSPYHTLYDEAWELVGMIRFENYDLFEECNNAIYSNRTSNGRFYCHMDDAIVDLAKEIIRSSIFQAITSNLTNPIQ
jgi:hypothetical protein